MITITEKIITEAINYLPLREKEKLAAEIAEKSLELVKINVDYGGDIRPIPPMTREDTSKKSRYLMGVFAGRYLKIPFEPVEDDETKTLPDENTYDSFASSHIFDQMEKMKRTAGLPPETKAKVYEIMSDFRDFEKRVNAGIYSLISMQNDVCSRLMIMMDAQTTPDALQRAEEELERVRGELEEYAAAKKEKADE